MSKNKVLFVDDEVKVLNSIKRSTMEEDYETFIATSGEKALEVLDQHEFSVLVTDMRMPGMDGLTLLKKVKVKYPNIIRIVVSGYNQLPQILTTVNQVGVSKFITKPWLVEEDFLPAIRDGIEYYNLKKEGEELKRALVNRNASYQKILQANNEVMINIKKDLNNVKLLHDTIQNINKAILLKLKSGKDITSQFNSFSNISSKVFHSFLSTQPTRIEDFSFNRLKNDVINCLNENVELESDKTDLTFRGNYKLILLIITELCEELVKGNPDNKYIIDVEECSQSKLILAINKTNSVELNFDSGDLSLLVFLLNVLNNTISGNVVAEKEGIRVTFVF